MSDDSRAERWPALTPRWTKASFVAWIVAILAVVFMSLNSKLGPPSEAGADKVFHCLGYLTLALLPHAGFLRRTAARWASGAMFPLGIAIEIAQGYVPGRFSDPWDALANTIGVVCGLALGVAFRRSVARIAAPPRPQ